MLNPSGRAVEVYLLQDGMVTERRRLAHQHLSFFPLSPTYGIALGKGISAGDPLDLNTLPYGQITLEGPGSADILIGGGGDLPVVFYVRNFVPA